MSRMLWGCDLVAAVAIGACGDGENLAEEALAGTRELDVATCSPTAGPFTVDIDNPFLPYAVGRSWVLEGEEDGEELRVLVSVLDETEEVAGITTRVVEEREWEAGDLVEVSRNFVVQAPDGTVCYYGEDVDEYEDGEIASHEGAWRAGVRGAQPGILMPGVPETGTSHKQEVAPGEAEDSSVIVALGESVSVPAGAFTDTLSVLDVNPIDNEVDEKKYARGVGILVDEVLMLTEFTR